MRRPIAWGVMLIGLALALFFAPTLLTRPVAAWLSARTGVPTSVAWMSWNPLVGRVTLHSVRLAVARDAAPIVTVGDVRVAIAIRPLLRGTLALDELVLVDPWVGVRRVAGGDFNLSALFPAAASAPSPAPTPAGQTVESRTLQVRRLRIEGGTVEFRDETTSPTLETSLYLEDIVADHLTVDLSGTTNVTLHLKSRLEREPLTLELTYRAHAGDSSLRARLETARASLARTLFYVPVGWQQVSGSLDVALEYAHDVVRNRLTTHTLTAKATLHDVALAEPWAPTPTVRARRVRVPALVVDFVRQRTELGTIDMDDFHALIARDDRGVHVPLLHGTHEAPDTGWRTVLSTVELGSGELLLRNVIANAEPELTAHVRTGAIRHAADELTFTLHADVLGGRVALSGSTAAEATTMRFELDGLSLPEVARQLRLPVGFATGRVDGNLLARFDEPRARFSGTLSLPGAKSLPPVGGDDGEVFAWHDLALELGESTLQPLAIHVTRATAGWPYLMIHRGASGIFPFKSGGAATDSPGGEPTPAPADAPPSADEGAPTLLIDEGHCTRGRAEFYDTTLTPPYWTELAEIDLSIRGLRMRPFTTERMGLIGQLDWISPLDVRGALGPQTSDLHAELERLRLAPLNPYLEPALGYRVRSGLASIDSAITLRGTNLEAENDLVLSRFAMSRTGDEPFEIGVPLPVALALMKDTRGDIRLPLTVRGDLAAQRYQIGSLILTGLREALAGTLRAPLRLLGSAFRREQPEQFDLQPVPFAPGDASLTPEAEEHIATLARLLQRHVALRVVLAPDPSPADATFFRDEELIARLSSAPERSSIEDAVLAALRARHEGASPAALAPEATEALARLTASVPTPRERLQALAAARGAAVARRLTETHGVAPSRVSQAHSTQGEPQPETLPGVDVQLRGE